MVAPPAASTLRAQFVFDPQGRPMRKTSFDTVGTRAIGVA